MKKPEQNRKKGVLHDYYCLATFQAGCISCHPFGLSVTHAPHMWTWSPDFGRYTPAMCWSLGTTSTTKNPSDFSLFRSLRRKSYFLSTSKKNLYSPSSIFLVCFTTPVAS